MRCAGRRFSGIPILLLVASACGAPTAPSRTSPSAPAAAPSPNGQDIRVTLRGTVTEAGGGPLADATIDVTDGPDTGKAATTDAVGRYTLAGLTPGSITVRAGKIGYVDSSLTVSLASAAVTQDFTIGKSALPPLPRPGSGGIFFVGSDPAPGGETVMTDSAGFVYLRELRMQFAVQFDTALPDAKLEIELFGDAGQQCAYAFVDHAIPANQSVAVAVDTVFDWQFSACPFPAAIASVRATLLTLREPAVNGRLTRTDYETQSFPLRYSIRRYPSPPPGAPASAPTISDLTWRVMLPVGGDPPLAGDPVSITCAAKESDGAAMTVTLTLFWDHLTPLVYTQPFPAGASSSSSGASFGIAVSAPVNNGQPAPHARLECIATNDRGQSATKATEIGRPQ